MNRFIKISFQALVIGFVLFNFIAPDEAFALKLPAGYEDDIDEGIKVVDKTAGLFKNLLFGVLASIIIIATVIAFLLKAIPSRELKEKGKAILVDNFVLIALVVIGLPLLLSVLSLVKL